MNTVKKYCLYFLLLINLLIIGIFWWQSSGSLFLGETADFLLALGRISGLMAVYFVLCQFLLMGRSKWLEQIFGLDKLAKIHRLNGYLSILFIIIHPILLVYSYALLGKVGIIAQFLDFLFNYQDVFSALIAVLLFISVVFFSIYIVRKHLKYESWYYVHLLTYLAVLLAFGHQLGIGGDFLGNMSFVYYWYLLYAFVFGNVLLFRFIRPIYNFYKYSFVVSDIVGETKDATSVYIKGKNLQSFKMKAGQFVILRFLAKGFWPQAHPFSLSKLTQNDQFRVTIKRLGDFTKEIPNLKIGTKVLVEGPYGVFTAPIDFAKQNKKFLFLAAGVGITPIRALIEQLAPQADLMLLYANRNSKDIILKKELDDLAIKYIFPLYYIISDEPAFVGEKGRIDQEKLLRLVKDIKERQVYLCGPWPMMDSLIKILLQIGLKPSQIHYEQFAF